MAGWQMEQAAPRVSGSTSEFRRRSQRRRDVCAKKPKITVGQDCLQDSGKTRRRQSADSQSVAQREALCESSLFELKIGVRAMFLWQKGSHARFCSRSRTALPEFVATARSRPQHPPGIRLGTCAALS